MIDEECPAQ